MNSPIAALEQEREEVLKEMRSIDRLRRGAFSQHFLRRREGGKLRTHGPYFVLQGYLRGKKFSQHIPAEQAAQVAVDVENYQHFQTLADRFVTLTDELTRLEAQPDSKKNSGRRK
jgi:hypothetical protein